MHQGSLEEEHEEAFSSFPTFSSATTYRYLYLLLPPPPPRVQSYGRRRAIRFTAAWHCPGQHRRPRTAGSTLDRVGSQSDLRSWCTLSQDGIVLVAASLIVRNASHQQRPTSVIIEDFGPWCPCFVQASKSRRIPSCFFRVHRCSTIYSNCMFEHHRRVHVVNNVRVYSWRPVGEEENGAHVPREERNHRTNEVLIRWIS